MSFLDIIIPQYKETDEVVSQLLNSINIQKGINYKDINIIIVNDYSDVILSNDLFRKYPHLNVSYHKMKKNGGPGLARQFGVDNSSSEYITFIDADDVFYDEYSLYIAISCLKDIKPEVLFTSTAQEVYVDNSLYHKHRRKSEVFNFLHGKFIRRDFLEKNNIRFHPSLRFCEDSYYCTILTAIAKIEYVDYVTYLWKTNSDSITRKNRKYNVYVEHFDDFYRGGIEAYSFIKDINPSFSELLLIKALIGNYVILESNLFDFEELSSIKEDYINKINNKIKEEINVFTKYENQLRDLFIEECNKLKKSNGDLIIGENTFSDFMKRIG